MTATQKIIGGLVVALALSAVAYAQFTAVTRTTLNGCGTGHDPLADGYGSHVVTWFSEVFVSRPGNILPVRWAWLTLLNPTPRAQTVLMRGFDAGSNVQTQSVYVPAYARLPVNLGDRFWTDRRQVEMGLELHWETLGAATISLWNEAYSDAISIQPINGCVSTWVNPYGL